MDRGGQVIRRKRQRLRDHFAQSLFAQLKAHVLFLLFFCRLAGRHGLRLGFRVPKHHSADHQEAQKHADA